LGLAAYRSRQNRPEQVESAISFHDVSKGEAGFQTGNAGQARQLILMETAAVVNAGHADLKHVVILAGHEVETDNAFGAPAGLSKAGGTGADWRSGADSSGPGRVSC
jgi:hypothetical protein